jgi:hypothetical protein
MFVVNKLPTSHFLHTCRPQRSLHALQAYVVCVWNRLTCLCMLRRYGHDSRAEQACVVCVFEAD